MLEPPSQPVRLADVHTVSEVEAIDARNVGRVGEPQPALLEPQRTDVAP